MTPTTSSEIENRQGVRPEHWIAFIAGDVAAIAAWVVTRQLPLAVLVAGLVYVVVYLVARRRK